MSELIREQASKIEELEAELEEQCRLNGMGSEREAKLLGEVERLKKQSNELLCALVGLRKFAESLAYDCGWMTIDVQESLKEFDVVITKTSNNICKKCGGQMRPGIATGQTWAAGTPDFQDQTIGVTMSPGGPGKIIECLKCESCGWSVGK